MKNSQMMVAFMMGMATLVCKSPLRDHIATFYCAECYGFNPQMEQYLV